MKFSITQTELQNAMTTVMKGVSARASLPILSGVLVSARNDTLNLQTTDLQLSVQCAAPALVEEEGQTVLPAKLLSTIVKNLPDAAISVKADDGSCLIACNNASYSLKTMLAEDFPAFPTVDQQQSITIPFEDFVSMVKKVSRSASKDTTRAIITGILIECAQGVATMVTTDNYRLAVVSKNIGGLADFSAVISSQFLSDVASLPYSQPTINLGLSENQAIVTYGNTVLVNRRLEGKFPPYKRLLPESFATTVQIPTRQLVSSIRRVSLLGHDSSPVKIDIDPQTESLQLFSSSQEVGSAQEMIRCQIQGEPNRVAFSYLYLLDGLSAADAEEIELCVNADNKPGIFRTKGEIDFLYLVMPVRAW